MDWNSAFAESALFCCQPQIRIIVQHFLDCLQPGMGAIYLDVNLLESIEA